MLISMAHILFIYKDTADPPVPNVKHFEENLENFDFPLIFKFCFLHKDLIPVLRDLGYEGISSFYQGQSRYNSSLYGWNGHTPDGGTKASIGSIESKGSR